MLLTPLSPRLERSTRELNDDAIASNQQLFLVFFITNFWILRLTWWILSLHAFAFP